ncbi:rhodanese-like domain-containing protein [Flavihumibacter rivuli]|uniref:rhodanese-like domain-containing protein n=1 Tax=Flavihumibacter rivuli TaxID=2838156 RepID=UPI001BDED069|nr:rhodanese-like domain-containing protein [Flavihumibacter rivuli]ULQ55416.1 rhodanese-like domain-containing protein [Flavihumibacter rivuli]
MFGWIKRLLGGTPVDFKELVGKGAVIVDVRTPGEFGSGHINQSVNIPLDTLKQNITKLRNMQVPVIAVCRSGNRSSMAVAQLKQAGIEAYNGGAWTSLQNRL